MTRSLARALAAELIGTFALVFAGAGAIMVDAKTHQLGPRVAGALAYQFLRGEQPLAVDVRTSDVREESA